VNIKNRENNFAPNGSQVQTIKAIEKSGRVIRGGFHSSRYQKDNDASKNFLIVRKQLQRWSETRLLRMKCKNRKVDLNIVIIARDEELTPTTMH